MKAKFQQGTVIAACFGSLLWASAAYADGWPASVQGNWSVVANQSSGTLSITQPSSSLNCKPISGYIFATSSTIQGFYCPASGRISFARRNSSGVPYQYYQGNLSQTGNTLRIGGSFAVFNSSGGSLGEYSFYGTK